MIYNSFSMLEHSAVIVDHGPTMPSENMELYILRFTTTTRI